ncbi:slit homolog 3 protein [Strongylocentrotus purpuratus]|uniref:TIR domain-containing protein n=1 Tax=Strongylocentrotus purpuratus TaxID=7668 RepID=A0A7M7REZ5_STRPU|nr:slit homolog 3 protein [Strongylocentrotus purpuratus]
MAVYTISCKICLELLLLAVGLIWLQVQLSDAFGAETVKTPTKCRLKNSSHGVIANCEHLGLTEVPQDLPQGVTELNLSVNKLTVLYNGSFQGVPNVTLLNLQVNPINSIQSRTFWKLTKLSTLIIIGNNLDYIPPKIFLKNLLLTKLLLNGNHLEAVPHEAFSDIPNLSNVELAGNKIKSLNFEGCSQWNHLEYVNLKLNEVEEIQQEDFLPLQNTTIGTLTLMANKIQILQPQCFLHLNSIPQILLGGNHINSFDIQPFLGMTYIEHLSLFGCQIHDLVPPDLPSNLSITYPTIKSLTLSTNKLETVQEGALWGFTTLEVLSLSLNKLRLLTNKSFCRLESLTELDISYNKLTSFSYGTFACLQNLKQLNASGNLLQTLSPGYFHGMSSILTISLSSNRIDALNNDQQLWTIKTLCMLDISNNALDSVSKERFNGLTNLEALNISGNNINYYSYTAFTGLLNLKELHLKNEQTTFLQNSFCQLHTLLILDLSNAPIQVSPASTEQFSNMSSLSELRMEKARLKDTVLYDQEKHQSLVTGLFSLRKLRIKDNFLYDLDVRIFQNLSQLVHLDMTNSRIHTLRSGLFSPLPSLRYLYISENNLVEVPGDLFNGLFGLKVLYFQNNILSSLDPKTFAQTLTLTDLYLPGNQISTIKPGTVLPGNTSLRFDVSKNPFTCTCPLAWFRQWLDSADIDFKHADQTLCSGTSLKGLSKQPILSFHPEDHCGVNVFLIVGISLTGIFLFLITMLAYNRRWWLNHKLFLLKLAVVGYEEMAEAFDADNYKFHLNLMFLEEEEEWVDRVMKPALEERLPHLQNIIYGDKDLHLGMFYINAINDALDNSFKTVLLISNQSIRDAWCMTKLRMALEHLNETGLDKIILIFVEDIEDENLPYLVRLFMSRNKPYMLWMDDEDGQELFWAQFERSMRANKAINNAIPL